MFFRRKSQLPEVSVDSYSRWLRAQRPPWIFFLSLGDEEQETLAALGDEHWQDVAIAIGYSVRDPSAADAALSAAGGDTAAEETLARRVAADLIGKIVARREVPQEAPRPTSRPAPLSMGGIGERQAEASEAREMSQHKSRSLFGRPPDQARDA